MEEIVRDFMFDSTNGYGDAPYDNSDFAGFDSSTLGFGEVSTWDYGADGLARRPSASDLWATQQVLTPGASYDLGLDPSNSGWPDISLSEFLKSPSPIPQVSASLARQHATSLLICSGTCELT